MTSKSEWTPDQIRQFKALSLKITQARFAKKCEYPDDYEPTIEPAPKKEK